MIPTLIIFQNDIWRADQIAAIYNDLDEKEIKILQVNTDTTWCYNEFKSEQEQMDVYKALVAKWKTALGATIL